MISPEHCVLCNAPRVQPLARSHAEGAVTYELYGCSACKAEFWWPLKNPGAHWYEHDERYAGRNKSPILEPNWNHKKIISFLSPAVGRVLDIGCGVGNFLAWAKKNGWEPTGIDFDADAIEAGKRTFGLRDLFISDLQQFAAAHPGVRFDLITFFDVLEHLDNHHEFISQVRELLVSGGHIAMSMPYRAHAQWLMPADVPPRHLTRWDRESLQNFLEREGFRVVYMTRRSEGLRYLILKLRFRYGKKFSFGLVDRARAQDTASPVSRPGTKTFKLRAVQLLAKTKDAVLFGIPALAIYLYMLPGRSRYITLYAIAQKL
jgi:SAM-dependent methyltransferase